MCSSIPFITSVVDGRAWSAPRPGRFTLGKGPVHIVQEAGWAPGPVWADAENLAPHRYWIPGPSSQQQAAVRTNHPGPQQQQEFS